MIETTASYGYRLILISLSRERAIYIGIENILYRVCISVRKLK